jgi:hypothetical protein
MIATRGIGAHLRAAFARAAVHTAPFRYWLLEEALPVPAANAICALRFAPAPVGDTKGRRETNNESRIFFAPENWERFPVMRSVATAFQNAETVAAIETAFSRKLGGSCLRIEYCQDTEGFWLEPHTDIAAKLITMVIYLSTGTDTEEWGTDLYDGNKKWVGRAPAGFDQGLVFVPAGDTWHGWASRPIQGVRRSLIVNFVSPDWRARHELSFPDRPV